MNIEYLATRWTPAILLGVALQSAAWPLLALESVSTSGPIEEVVVTAQRRAESSQDVPISMSVLDQDAIKKMQTSSDLAQLVPNVQLENFVGFGIPRTGIRGIASADFNAISTTSNMVYLDDLPLNAGLAQGIPIWDLERAEVLRGPQGTLYGRNATGGAIRYIAATPTQQAEGYVDVTLGRFDQREVKAGYGGMLTDNLGARVSMVSNSRDGDYENVYRGVDQGKQSWYGVRGVFTWDPSANVGFELRAQYFESDQDIAAWKSTPGVTASDAFGPAPSPLVNGWGSVAQLQAAYGFENLGEQSNFEHYESDVNPNEHIEHLPVSLTIDWDLGFATLTSVTGYLDLKQSFIVDNDSTPAPILTEFDQHDVEQKTQEFRLASASDGGFEWIAGFFYMEEEIEASLDFDGTAWWGNVNYGFPDADTVIYRRGAAQDTESWALFLHTTYDLSEDLQLITAARYTEEEKSIDYRFRSFWEFPTSSPRQPGQFNDFLTAVRTGNLGTQLAPGDGTFSGSDEWNAWTWRVGLDYHLNDDTLLYGFVSRGFKGGSFKPTANSLGEVVDIDGSILSVDPEFIIDYELGVKADLFEKRMRINAGVFFYDYQDYQTNQLDPFTASQILSNLPEAEVYGAELEIDYALVEDLYARLGVGAIHTEITDSLDPGVEGNKLPLAESFNANWSIRYDFRLPIGTISPEISGDYRGEYYTTKENVQELGDYVIWNARVGYRSNDQRYFGDLWIRNIDDTVEPILIDDSSEFFGSNIAWLNARRAYGVTFGAQF